METYKEKFLMTTIKLVIKHYLIYFKNNYIIIYFYFFLVTKETNFSTFFHYY